VEPELELEALAEVEAVLQVEVQEDGKINCMSGDEVHCRQTVMINQ